MAKQQAKDDVIDVLSVSTGVVQFCVLGSTPMIMNRMATKAKRELLLPAGRKTAADKAQNLKHNPLGEYRDSIYTTRDASAPAALAFWATGFKGALRSAALDVPGARKTEIGRLVRIEGVDIPVYGKPELLMSTVRSADINRTPDIRTRAIIPEWAARVTVRFIQGKLNAKSVANLFAWSGETIGVGDFRQEKGAGSYGLFRLVGEDDADFQRIVTQQGRAVQEAAIENPEPHDAETEELLSWFRNEVERRGHKVAA